MSVPKYMRVECATAHSYGFVEVLLHRVAKVPGVYISDGGRFEENVSD